MQFSIVIPTYNREKALRRCLAAIAAMDYPHENFEVIVIDDGSARSLREVSSEFSNQIPLRIFRQRNSGPASARNVGSEHANGDLLAFLDDDCAPRKDWLTQLDLAVGRTPESLIGGTTLNGCAHNIFAEFNQCLLDAVSGWFLANESALQFFPSNNLAMKAAAFRAIGGFDATITVAAGEDREFCARWCGSGRRMVRVPEARVDHYHPQDLFSFLEMHFRYGRGAWELHQRLKTSPFHFVTGGLYQHLLMTFVRRKRSLVECALWAASQLATATGFFYARSKRFS